MEACLAAEAEEQLRLLGGCPWGHVCVLAAG